MLPKKILKTLSLTGLAAFFATPAATAAGDNPAFSYLQVEGQKVVTANHTSLEITGPKSFKLIGPYNFLKPTENGFTFEVSLASFVTPDTVVSIPAERLISADEKLDYSGLPPARWPDSTYRTHTSACMTMTKAQAAQLPKTSGVQWVVAAGFVPEGDFVVGSTITSSADGKDEVSVEIIKRVPSCKDLGPDDIESTINQLRDKFQVKTER